MSQNFLYKNPIVARLEEQAKINTLSHAYLFFGPWLVGKRTFGLRLARILEHGDGDTEKPLHDILSLSSEMGVEAAREVKSFLYTRPAYSKRRTVLFCAIDGATRVTSDALLKTIEEPHRDTLILLTATHIDAVPDTILSRVQSVYFAPVESSRIESWLTEKTKVRGLTSSASHIHAAVAQAGGLPGLAWRLLHDAEFLATLTTAQKYLRTTPASVSAFVKDMLETHEDFSLPIFLDFLLLALSFDPKTPSAFLQKTIALARDAREYNLNPKLQLIALKQ